jgi:small subunit ribosomal protein S1
MKQLVPTSLDEYIAEHKTGDVVTGRVVDASASRAKVELGEGVVGICRLKSDGGDAGARRAENKADLSSLSEMLAAKWKSGSAPGASGPETVRAGQVRSFKIVSLDPANKKIEVEPV